MGDARPLVSIGLPVYNGGAHLRRALDSLLGQDYAEIEIIVRDNESSDDTAAIVREYAARDARVRSFRNASNLGAVRNFELVLADAAGRYFMWAAHDDRWSSDYVGRLVQALDRHPGAVLETGRARFVDPAGLPSPGVVDSHAPGATLEPWLALLRWHATHWIYGVFVRERLLELVSSLWTHRPWGGDMVWLLGLSASSEIAGDEDAVLYKTLKESPHLPSTPRARVEWQLWYGRSLLREILTSRLPLGEKLRASGAVAAYWWRYVTHSGLPYLLASLLAAARDVVLRRK